jgi:colanic acid/amylovoran biosynthesis protein
MIKGKKLIQIRGTNFNNKGAELMLYAVLEKMKHEFPEAEFAMEPKTPYFKRAELRFYQIAQLRIKNFEFGILAKLIPARIRERYGIVLIKEVDIVIDASGFQYTDQWGTNSCLELADSCKRWKKNGTKVILLPQAFGPYKIKSNQKSIKIVLDHADLVFAREKISYDYLVDIAGERPNLKIAPDFTNLIENIAPENFDNENNQFCIVPNYRMVDKTNKKDSESYLPFMTEVTRYAYEKGQKPFILVHGDINDLILAEKICDAVNTDIQIIKETNPLKIKGILGASSATLGSRFHGLVSALSQGVPALAVGWSHKYQMLFEDYGFSEGLLDLHAPIDELHKKMDLFFNVTSKEKIVRMIKKNNENQEQQARKMWDEVIAFLKT